MSVVKILFLSKKLMLSTTRPAQPQREALGRPQIRNSV
ncbi:hypothetical protein YPPY89_1415, partial [Yersinia pestis PY-89]